MKSIGRKPDLCIIDELTHCDFSQLEERVLADLAITGTAISRTYFDEKDRLIREHIPVEEIYQQVGHRTFRHPQFDHILVKPHRGMGKVESFRFIPHTNKPADHPTRKREPKGPRGKWGKLK